MAPFLQRQKALEFLEGCFSNGCPAERFQGEGGGCKWGSKLDVVVDESSLEVCKPREVLQVLKVGGSWTLGHRTVTSVGSICP